MNKLFLIICTVFSLGGFYSFSDEVQRGAHYASMDEGIVGWKRQAYSTTYQCVEVSARDLTVVLREAPGRCTSSGVKYLKRLKWISDTKWKLGLVCQQEISNIADDRDATPPEIKIVSMDLCGVSTLRTDGYSPIFDGTFQPN